MGLKRAMKNVWKGFNSLLGYGLLAVCGCLLLVAAMTSGFQGNFRANRQMGRSGAARGIAKLLIAVLGAALFIAACGKEVRVDPAAVSEIHAIGRVLTEGTSEWHWGDEGPGYTSLNKTVVLDMGSTTAQAALEKARALLIERGWEIDAPAGDGSLSMTSGRWQGLQLFAYSVKQYVQIWGLEDVEEPQVAEVIKRARERSTSDALLVVKLQP
ncbi:hypothetical protein ACIBKY_29485 [Nonomuraea sp. NPDC050394]|uniref:hypothetical protein n=1 Tax=Nonomuraea sp. NPDC050394 TaxID=3364363 RepID=UPI003793F76E